MDRGVDPSLEGRDPPRPIGLGSLLNHASCGWMSSTSGEVSGGQPFWKSASGVFSWGRRTGLRFVWGGSAERSPPASTVLQSVVRPSVTQPQHPLGTC